MTNHLGLNRKKDRKVSHEISSERRTAEAHLDLNLVEGLSIVDTNDAADHLGDDNHVAEVSLNGGGLLVGEGLLLGLPQALDESHGLPLKTPVEATAGAAREELHELLGGDVKKLLQINTPVGELAEGPLLPELSGVNLSCLNIFNVLVSLGGKKR